MGFKNALVASPADLSAFGGPAGPYGAALSTFNGAAANGTWNLYVLDTNSGDTGQIAGGWSIEVTTVESGTCYPPLTANAVVGSMPNATQAYYEPGKEAQGVVLNAGTYYVLGVDESGGYYAIVLACDRLWVPAASMVPNTNPDDAAWYGHPLPMTVIGS